MAEEGRRELANDLASVDNNLGLALASSGDLAGAVAAYQRAREVRARLVEEEGRHHVLPDLCMTLYNLLQALAKGEDGRAGEWLGEACAHVAMLALRYREAGFERLPAPWLAELRDAVGLAAAQEGLEEMVARPLQVFAMELGADPMSQVLDRMAAGFQHAGEAERAARAAAALATSLDERVGLGELPGPLAARLGRVLGLAREAIRDGSVPQPAASELKPVVEALLAKLGDAGAP